MSKNSGESQPQLGNFPMIDELVAKKKDLEVKMGVLQKEFSTENSTDLFLLLNYTASQIKETQQFLQTLKILNPVYHSDEPSFTDLTTEFDFLETIDQNTDPQITPRKVGLSLFRKLGETPEIMEHKEEPPHDSPKGSPRISPHNNIETSLFVEIPGIEEEESPVSSSKESGSEHFHLF